MLKKFAPPKSELLFLRYVGPKTIQYLRMVGITTIAELAQAHPDNVYERLNAISKKNPVVWDVFAAIIHEAKTGEQTDWWLWTEVRKSRNFSQKSSIEKRNQ